MRNPNMPIIIKSFRPVEPKKEEPKEVIVEKKENEIVLVFNDSTNVKEHFG